MGASLFECLTVEAGLTTAVLCAGTGGCMLDAENMDSVDSVNKSRCRMEFCPFE